MRVKILWKSKITEFINECIDVLGEELRFDLYEVEDVYAAFRGEFLDSYVTEIKSDIDYLNCLKTLYTSLGDREMDDKLLKTLNFCIKHIFQEAALETEAKAFLAGEQEFCNLIDKDRKGVVLSFTEAMDECFTELKPSTKAAGASADSAQRSRGTHL